MAGRKDEGTRREEERFVVQEVTLHTNTRAYCQHIHLLNRRVRSDVQHGVGVGVV